MAQWSRAERTLYAKLVYYGPAFGGKTTNLEALHRITDPDDSQQLLSVRTSDDRTLFFDLLPFDLGNILGYQVAMKVYTVPGQVRYDATRRVVLAGADAIVFVADSTRGREKDNRESLLNLRNNMRVNRLDPANVPILFQYNKQDVQDALPRHAMARILDIRRDDGFPAIAVRGRGVMETFMAAGRAMLERLSGFADGLTRREFDIEKLRQQVDRAFAPILARSRAAASLPDVPATLSGLDAPDPTIVVGDGQLLEQSVVSSLRLGEQLSSERSRAIRLDTEAHAMRELSDALRRTATSFDRDRIVDQTLGVVSQVVGAAVVSLIRMNGDGRPAVDRVRGADRDLLQASPGGTLPLQRMSTRHGPCVVDDVAAEFGEFEGLRGIRSVAVVPVDPAEQRFLVAYAPMPDGNFTEEDVRFLATVAAHLSVGLEKARLHVELEAHRDTLERRVEDRTAELRHAYDRLRTVERMKDRFLSNVSHEMRTPLTGIVGAATFIRDYAPEPEARVEMSETILASCGAIGRRLDDLFRVVRLEGAEHPLQLSEATPADVAFEAVRLAGSPECEIEVSSGVDAMLVDLPELARAIANLLDNARKFSPPGAPIEMRIEPAEPGSPEREGEAVVVRVLDRGAGVQEPDRRRIFEPFEQGGDDVTGKPPGIGLGLHEARHVARRHGGTLELRPRPGGGSEFRLTFLRIMDGSAGVLEALGA